MAALAGTSMTNQSAPLIYLDPKAGSDRLLVLESSNNRHLSYRPISVHRYRQDAGVNFEKNLNFPSLRGTWLPSCDKQSSGSGIAMNWLGIRVRVELMG